MKAYSIDRYKSTPRLVDLPEPVAGAGEVLVRVEAASVNQLDVKTVEGEFTQILPQRLPLVLGNDLAGTVLAVGPGVDGFAPGEEVWALADKRRVGTFAERFVVHQRDLAHRPAGLTAVEAASLPLVALTAWQALVERTAVRPGQKVLVHAGSGGLGTVAIQLAKHLGATVATTASAKNRDLLTALGADVVVDYRTQDFTEVLSDYDVVLDGQGAKSVERSLRVLRPGGTVIGLAGPPDPAFAQEIDGGAVLKVATRLLSRSARRTAAHLGVHYSFLFVRADGRQLAQVTELVESGAIRPVVDRVFPFEATPEALAEVAKGRTRGKVVISVP